MSAIPDLIPVTLLTGFLGSGKTTLLRSLLARPELGDTAVLINEFGEVGLDHKLVRASTENVVLLESGCICCTVQGELVEELRELYSKRLRGEVPMFRRVIIETTGLADPAPILHALIYDRIVASMYRLDGVVTTVDGVLGETTLDAHFESVKQAAVADRLLITKTDAASPGVAAALEARLRELNPAAPIHRIAGGVVDPTLVLDAGLYDVGRNSPDVQRWLRFERYRPVAGDVVPGGAAAAIGGAVTGRSAPRHDERIRTFSVTFDEPVSGHALSAALDMLANFRGENLLRVKGIVNLAGDPLPKVVHLVQHILYPVVSLPAWPDDDRRTRLVFIVRDLEPAFVRETLHNFIEAA
jgi:G3E family GTPase